MKDRERERSTKLRQGKLTKDRKRERQGYVNEYSQRRERERATRLHQGKLTKDRESDKVMSRKTQGNLVRKYSL